MASEGTPTFSRVPGYLPFARGDWPFPPSSPVPSISRSQVIRTPTDIPTLTSPLLSSPSPPPCQPSSNTSAITPTPSSTTTPGYLRPLQRHLPKAASIPSKKPSPARPSTNLCPSTPEKLKRHLGERTCRILLSRFNPLLGYFPCQAPPSSSHPSKNPYKIPYRKKRICITGCRYLILCSVATACGFQVVSESELWNIHWSDLPLRPEKILQMRHLLDITSNPRSRLLQRFNHFPGMYEICRKDLLGHNLNRLRRLFPHDYNYFPETFHLPLELSDLKAYQKRQKQRLLTFIIKPESGSQGKGIYLLQSLQKLTPGSKCVCQVYLPRPFLIDGYKFDLRFYVLITSVDPLRIYLYEEGIARFATVKYEEPCQDNLEVVYMHLTNYSLNKFSASYVREGEGSKRTLGSVYEWMSSRGHNVEGLQQRLEEIVVKTLLCAGPTLKHNYKTSFPKRGRGRCCCFELLGFDGIIDEHLNPMLLEVNHSPSLNCDLEVDAEVKTEMMRDLMEMVWMGEEVRGIRGQWEHEMERRGGFKLIFWGEEPGKYERLLGKDRLGYLEYEVGGGREEAWELEKEEERRDREGEGTEWLEVIKKYREVQRKRKRIGVVEGDDVKGSKK